MKKNVPRYLSTCQVAQAAGVHPNTVRLYETWGFLPPIPRSPKNYRRYTEFHRDQMILARTALSGPWPGRAIRHSALAMVRCSATGDLGGALEMAYQHLTTIRAERAHAETAVHLLERWAQGAPADATQRPLNIHQAAQLLNITVDTIRNWERNNLVTAPRNPRNQYRMYTLVEISRMRVIRMLRQAGYSLLAILRMLKELDQGQTRGLGQVLDTPLPDEDVYMASDRWLTSLQEHEIRAQHMIELLEKMIERQQIERSQPDWRTPD